MSLDEIETAAIRHGFKETPTALWVSLELQGPGDDIQLLRWSDPDSEQIQSIKSRTDQLARALEKNRSAS
jgi:hypothetical protein